MNRLSFSHILTNACFLVGLTLLGAGAAEAGTCRVAVNGLAGNDGTTWASAMPLQGALHSPACTEIWVASGRYKPGSSPGESFVVPADTRVFGGFSGNETARAQRDPAAHLTILSGDIDNNDAIDSDGITPDTSAIVGTNSEHVVTMNGNDVPIGPSTVLDGFIITAADSTDDGGGLWCRASLKTTSECSPQLRRLRFQGNRAANGGGIYFGGEAGAASTARLADVSFVSNRATERGGAIYNSGYSNGNSSPRIERATFAHNSADVAGGAIYNGGYANGRSDPIIVNASFVGNTSMYGGAISGSASTSGHVSPILTNVTFSGNQASAQGNAMQLSCNNGTCGAAIRNAIIWDTGNAYAGEFVGGVSTMTIQRSIVHAGCPVGANCQAVVIADPLLGPLQDNGGFTPTMLPQDWSAAIDAVSCSRAPFQDQRGAPRPDPLSAGLAARCDLGAVEVDAMPSDSIFADGFGLLPLRK